MTPSTLTPAPVAALCPLCGQPNQCAMEVQRLTGVEQGPCWCTQASFSQSLLEQIPASLRGLACVCAACVAANQG
jgi:hypothetical protein